MIVAKGRLDVLQRSESPPCGDNWVVHHRVVHATHGEGSVTRISLGEDKPIEVSFDRGQMHHYSLTSASTKLAKVEERVYTVGDKVVHAARGEGVVVPSPKSSDPKIKVRYHDGTEHSYGHASLHKLKPLEGNGLPKDTTSLPSDTTSLPRGTTSKAGNDGHKPAMAKQQSGPDTPDTDAQLVASLGPSEYIGVDTLIDWGAAPQPTMIKAREPSTVLQVEPNHNGNVVSFCTVDSCVCACLYAIDDEQSHTSLRRCCRWHAARSVRSRNSGPRYRIVSRRPRPSARGMSARDTCSCFGRSLPWTDTCV